MKTPSISRKSVVTLALACVGFAGVAQAASIQIYKQPNFAGAQVTLNGVTPDLAGRGFQDQASSLVLDGSWELCSQPNFAGDCRVLGPGRYATLDQVLNHRVESVRPVAGAQAYNERRDMARADTYRYGDRRRDWREERARGAIEIFPGQDFRGPSMRIDRDTDLVERGERASSVMVLEGTWQLCSRPNYEGRCRTFEPGRYASLGPLDNNVASAKLLR